MADTIVSLYNSFGNTPLVSNCYDRIKVERSRVEMSPGSMLLELPIYYSNLFIMNGELIPDRQVRIFRSVGGQPRALDLDTFWFVEEVTDVLESSGAEYLQVRATDSLGLLSRRIIPYSSTDPMADKTGFAGNLIKAFVRENFGSLATDTTRDLSSYITVDADMNDGVAVDYTAQNPRLITALQEIADSSAKQGTYIGYDLLCNDPSNVMTFRTFTTCRGIDRRNSVRIGRNRQNIQDVKMTYSVANEYNYAYVKGGKIGLVDISEERSSPDRIGLSPFNRREVLLNCGNEIDLDVLDDFGDQYIRHSRAKVNVSCNLVETSSFIYGINCTYGDYLTLDERDSGMNVRLSGISISEQNGAEVIKATLVGDLI